MGKSGQIFDYDKDTARIVATKERWDAVENSMSGTNLKHLKHMRGNP